MVKQGKYSNPEAGEREQNIFFSRWLATRLRDPKRIIALGVHYSARTKVHTGCGYGGARVRVAIQISGPAQCGQRGGTTGWTSRVAGFQSSRARMRSHLLLAAGLSQP